MHYAVECMNFQCGSSVGERQPDGSTTTAAPPTRHPRNVIPMLMGCLVHECLLQGRRYYAVTMFCLIAALLYADQNLLAPTLSLIAKDFGFNDVVTTPPPPPLPSSASRDVIKALNRPPYTKLDVDDLRR